MVVFQHKKCVYMCSMRAVANVERTPFVLESLKVAREIVDRGVGFGVVGAYNSASKDYAVTWSDGSISNMSADNIANALVADSLLGRQVMKARDDSKEGNEAAAKDGTITSAVLDRGGAFVV